MMRLKAIVVFGNTQKTINVPEERSKDQDHISLAISGYRTTMICRR